MHMVLMVGNIGSGKSTYVNHLLKSGYLNVSRDGLRYSIGGGEYLFDLKLEPAIKKVVLLLAEEIMKTGKNLVIDETNMCTEIRLPYIQLAKKYNYRSYAIIMPKYDMDCSIDRRLQSPHGNFDRSIWETVWKRFDSIYDEPSKDEGIDFIIKKV